MLLGNYNVSGSKFSFYQIWHIFQNRIYKVANRYTIREKVRQLKLEEALKKQKLMSENQRLEESRQEVVIEEEKLNFEQLETEFDYDEPKKTK